MKHKIVRILLSSYILLLMIILVIGLNSQKMEQPLMTETGIFITATGGEPDQDQSQFSKTIMDDVGTQNFTEVSPTQYETLVSPSDESTMEPTRTMPVEEPTFQPTSTSPPYPVMTDGEGEATSTPIPYPVDG